MTEKLLFRDPARTTEAQAEERALALGCPVIHHGLNTWMVEQGHGFQNLPFVGVVLCSVPAHNAAREILGVFRGAQLTKANLDAVQDCPPDPVPVRETLRAKIAAGIDLTLAEIRQAIKELL